MNPPRSSTDSLHDILDSIQAIREFTKGFSFDEFKRDRKTFFAVIRAFEIIGEASKCIPAEVINQYPEIPWKEMAGIRDILIHHYFGVDLDIIWKTIQQDLDDLEQKIQRIAAR